MTASVHRCTFFNTHLKMVPDQAVIVNFVTIEDRTGARRSVPCSFADAVGWSPAPGPAPGRRAGKAKPNVRLTLRSEDTEGADGEFSLDANVGDSVLRELYLRRDDLRKSATIGITLLDDDDGTGGGDEGGCSQTSSSCVPPAPPLSPATSAEPRYE